MAYRINSAVDNGPLASEPKGAHVEFYWNGKKLRGNAGESLATVLLANGIKVVGRSFKYGRPRGIFSYGVEEANALVTLEPLTPYQTPNLKATEIKIYDQMRATSATAHPFVTFDWRSLFKPFHKFMPAGFYYKTFKAPGKFWPYYEKFIRQLAGFSRHDASLKDEESYLNQYHYCELLVVGAGISGLQVALETARLNPQARVIVCEQDDNVGGETLSEVKQDQTLKSTLEKLRQEVESHQNIRLYTQTTVFGHYENGLSQCLQRIQTARPLAQRRADQAAQKLFHIRAHITILATGSLERPLLFKNNDLPGIMLASAVRRYLVQDGVIFAKNPVVVGNNNSMYELVEDLLIANVKPKIVDIRPEQSIPKKILDYCQEKNLVHYKGYAPLVAKGRGWGTNYGVHTLCVAPVDFTRRSNGSILWEIVGKSENIYVDGVAVSGGFNPVLHLSAQNGSRPEFNSVNQTFMPVSKDENLLFCGSVNGAHTWQDCVQDSNRKAKQISAHLQQKKLPKEEASVLDSTPPIFIPPQNGRAAFVDFQSDVKISDIMLAIRENYRSIEHIKRYTATGFGTDQGKTSNINAIAVAASEMRQPMEKFFTTTFRPPYTAVTFGAMAGGHQNEFFDARRYSPIHVAHLKHKPEWELVGQWYRPRYYPKAHENMQQALHRECLAARQEIAMMDVSTLGKIEIHGKDVREFLSRVYTNSWHKGPPPGQCRYGIMCDEKGMIMDDGVSACINDNHFYMTTTTGGAAHVYEFMELWLQTEWQDLDVSLTSVTEQWANVAIVGPKSREFMQSATSDIDFSLQSFPFMHWRTGEWNGFKVRIMRISFSGEISFEINVAADQGLELWQSIEALSQQKNYDITPYGTESMHVLRAEKGFIIVGQDTDGSNTPEDMGLSWLVKANEKTSFIGERSLKRSDLVRDKRKQFVGLLNNDDSQEVLEEGLAIIRGDYDKQDRLNPVIGHVASSYYSPILKHSIALAVVEDGDNIYGNILRVRRKDGQYTNVKIVSPIFYDPQGNIMKG